MHRAAGSVSFVSGAMSARPNPALILSRKTKSSNDGSPAHTLHLCFISKQTKKENKILF
jgi:hypothetical protein